MSPLLRLALPALAAAGSAYAASCSVSATTTIQNSGDATALASCKTFSGSIAVATGTSDNININGIQKIDGDFVVKNNSAIQVVGGDSLEEISGALTLNDVQILNTVNFPKLKRVDSISLNALPTLQQLGFTAQVTRASTIDIQNTQLQSLQGLNIEQIDTMNIVNNKYISDISMQLGNVTSQLTLNANNPDVNVSFPNMIWANNMTFRNCSSVFLPSLTATNDSLGFIGNTFQDFAAPNLTSVGGSLTVASNTELTNISFPELTKVQGTLLVANNTKLHEVSFPQLTTIKAALDFSGNFSKVDIPKLNEVSGAFNLQSTGDVQGTCDNFFKPLVSKQKIRGKFTCVGSVAKPGGEGTTPSVTSTGGTSKPTGAASGLKVQGSVIIGGLAAAAFFL